MEPTTIKDMAPSVGKNHLSGGYPGCDPSPIAQGENGQSMDPISPKANLTAAMAGDKKPVPVPPPAKPGYYPGNNPAPHGGDPRTRA